MYDDFKFSFEENAGLIFGIETATMSTAVFHLAQRVTKSYLYHNELKGMVVNI